MKLSSVCIPLSVGRLEQNVFSWRRKVVVATAAATALPTACSMLAVRRQEKALSPVRRRVRGTTRSRSKVSNGSQNVAKVVGATSSEGFLVTSTEIRRANVEMTARCVIWVGPRRHPSGPCSRPHPIIILWVGDGRVIADVHDSFISAAVTPLLY